MLTSRIPLHPQPGPEELAAAAGSGAARSSATAVATDAEAEAAAVAARAEAAARERLLQRWCAEALPSRAALLAAATSHMVLAQLRPGARESQIGFMWNGRSAALIDALLTHWALPPLGLHELTALGALLHALAVRGGGLGCSFDTAVLSRSYWGA